VNGYAAAQVGAIVEVGPNSDSRAASSGPASVHARALDPVAARRPWAELLGEQTWRESGLGAPQGHEQVKQRIVFVEQQAVDLRLQLDERDQELAAARGEPRAHDSTQRQPKHRCIPAYEARGAPRVQLSTEARIWRSVGCVALVGERAARSRASIYPWR
jgi:hypothetical protein